MLRAAESSSTREGRSIGAPSFWGKHALFSYNYRVSARAAVQFGRVLPAAVLVVGLIGLLRLARQFPAAAESPGLLVPFLMPVLALALEAGALVALSAAALALASRVASA